MCQFLLISCYWLQQRGGGRLLLQGIPRGLGQVLLVEESSLHGLHLGLQMSKLSEDQVDLALAVFSSLMERLDRARPFVRKRGLRNVMHAERRMVIRWRW